MNYSDVLAVLGIGSAHPGGFAATLETLRRLPIRSGSRVLEIGCGTGRTACYLAKHKHCQVTAVDIRDLMIEKAKLRALKERVSVEFLTADATKLPFDNESFDVVYVESVTVFTQIPKALSEYYRVTRSKGSLYDREMCQVKTFTPEVKRAIRSVYGVNQVPSFEGWIEAARKAGYSQAGLHEPSLIPKEAGLEDATLPDYNQEVSKEAFSPEVQRVIMKNSDFMKTFYSYLGFAVVCANKS